MVPCGPKRSRTNNTGDVWYSVDGSNRYGANPPAVFIPRHAGTAWVHNGALFVGSGNEQAADPANPQDRPSGTRMFGR
jgi:hypothetical protein